MQIELLRPYKTWRQRSFNGQALVEGVIALVLIISSTVLALLLLANSGMAVYYKEKLAVVSSKAADYAAAQPESSRNAETRAFVQELLQALGIRASSVDVDVSTVTVHSEPLIKVNVKCHGLPLIGNVFGSIDMADASVGSGLQSMFAGFVMTGAGGAPSAPPPLGAIRIPVLRRAMGDSFGELGVFQSCPMILSMNARRPVLVGSHE